MIDVPMMTDSRGSKLGDELEQDGEVAERQLAARALGQRDLVVVAVVLGAARLEGVEGVDLAAGVAEPPVHLGEEAQRVAVLVEGEQGELERQALDRDRERVAHRLADRDRHALADQALLDDLAAEQDADAQDALARPRRGRARLRLRKARRHQNGAFLTVARISGMKSCLRLSHS
jgi:hypothetical protein